MAEIKSGWAVCSVCGKEFEIVGNRKKCCSKACGEERSRRQCCERGKARYRALSPEQKKELAMKRKVLNELKHEESEAFRRYSESKGTAYAFSDKCSCDNWAKAIGIVKRGGRDEK